MKCVTDSVRDLAVAYLGFQKRGERGAEVVGAEDGSGEGTLPLPEKKLCPQNYNFGCIFTRVFLSHMCNNNAKPIFCAIRHDILRMFEDDNTTNYYTLI